MCPSPLNHWSRVQQLWTWEMKFEKLRWLKTEIALGLPWWVEHNIFKILGKMALIIRASKPVESDSDEVDDERQPVNLNKSSIKLAERLGIDLDLLQGQQIVLSVRQFQTLYESIEYLGEGCIATVKKVKHRATGDLFAAKIVKSTSEEIIRQMVVEFSTLLKIKHENIVKMHTLYIEFNDKFMGENEAVVLMELVDGHEMFEVINKLGGYTESNARTLFQQLLHGIQSLHQHGICHRDLKPHNILCQRDNQRLKITDFNVSKFIDAQKEFGQLKDVLEIEMWTYTGTIAYSAPERFVGGSYTQSVDMWSAGCILYSMLSGLLPFTGEYLHDLIEEIQTKEVQFSEPQFAVVSAEAKNLILQLLEKNPQRRITCSEALRHPWFQQDLSAYTLKHFSLSDSLQQLTKTDNIVKYKVILSQVSSSSRFGSIVDQNASDLSISFNAKKRCIRDKPYNYNQSPSYTDVNQPYNNNKNKFISDEILYKDTEDESVFPN